MAKVTSVVDTILAEAGGKTRAERLRDMKAIASVAVNRAWQLGVPLEDVISVPSEFNAYGKKMPAGVEEYRDLAEEALNDVLQNGPIHSATFYATPKAKQNLPKGLAEEAETAGHVYFSDPQNRSIRTAQGYVEPTGEAMLARYAPSERVEVAPSAFDSLFGGYSAMPQEELSGQRGVLSDEAASAPAGGVLADASEGYSSPFGVLGDRITSGFGTREAPRTPFGVGSSNHPGVDLSLQGGAAGYPVEAANGGVVTYAGPRKGYGNLVEIEHPDGMRTRYGHLQEVGNLAIGDQIARGTPVGLVGNEGRSKGPHLHFETIGQNGRPVDPSSVIDFNAASRVPTPVERPQEWQDATPVAVERQSLPDVSGGVLASAEKQKQAYGVLADTMSQTPSLGLSGAGADMGAASRMMDTAQVAQGQDGLRDAMLGEQSIGRASMAQMADMQAEANRARQEMDMRMGGVLSLSDAQRQDALSRRDTAMGVLTSSQPQDFGLASAQANQMQATPAVLSDPAPLPSNVAATQRLTGLAPTMTQTVKMGMPATGGLDISAPAGLNEFTGFQNNPALTVAKKTGVQPVGVLSMDPGVLSGQAAAIETVEGPATSRSIARTAKTSRLPGQTSGVLMTPEEYGVLRDQQIKLSNAGKNKAVAFKNALGALGGGLAGGLLAGPLGALLGGYLGNRLVTGPRGAGLDYYPERPSGGSRGDGRMTSYGQSVRDSSGQFDSAVSSGSKGLW